MLSKYKHPIYLCNYVDFRGRLYTDNNFFNFQGDSLAKNSLEFYEGVVLNETGVKYLKIYGANCYGLDKKSFEYRINWIQTNIEEIKSMNIDFILKADDPISFINFCINYNKYLNDSNVSIHIPIF